MRVFVAIAGLAFSLLAAAPALAQTPQCQTAGEATAIRMPPQKDVAEAFALTLMLQSVVRPAFSAAVSRDVPCQRGEAFKIGADDYTLTGENNDGQPRRVVATRADAPLYYLAEYADSRLRTQPGAPVKKTYALVRLDGESAAVAVLYVGVPPDAELKRITSALAGGIPVPLIQFIDGKVAISVPGPVPTSQQPSQSVRPDGVVFVAAPDGGALHRASGFTCPASFVGVDRVRVAIFDASEGGRDVGCSYGVPGSDAWFTLYLTKAADASNDEVFQTWVREAQQAAPPTGHADVPLAAGPPPLPTSAAFWTDASNVVQGLWVSKIGPWHVKLRTTFLPSHEADAANMARAVFAAFYAQVKAGGALASLAP